MPLRGVFRDDTDLLHDGKPDTDDNCRSFYGLKSDFVRHDYGEYATNVQKRYSKLYIKMPRIAYPKLGRASSGAKKTRLKGGLFCFVPVSTT